MIFGVAGTATAQAGAGTRTARPKPAKPAKPAPAPTPPPAKPTPPPRPAPRPPEVAKARYEAGAARYQAGDFLGAAVAFRGAYAVVADPAYLFDIAQAYRMGKDCGNAAPFYRAFLASAPARAPHREAAGAGLRACTGKAVAQAPDVEVREVRAEPAPILVDGDDGSAGLRVAGITTAGAGVLAAATAALFSWRAHSASKDIQAELADNGGMWTDALQSRADDAQRADEAAIGLSIGGAAAMLTGSLLWYLGRDHGAEVLVAPHGDGATVSWTGRF